MGRACESKGMTKEEAGLREAARSGSEDLDVLKWADWLDERGRDGAAAALRGLPRLAEALEKVTRRYADPWGRQRLGHLFLIAASPVGGWGCGSYWGYGRAGKFEEFVASGDRWPAWGPEAGTHPDVNPLLEHWAEVYPAAEWLARKLGRQVVQSRCAPFNSLKGRRTCDLSVGQRLRPPEPGRPVRMCRLLLSADW